MSPEERRRLRVIADEAEARAKEAKARGEALSALGFLELAVMARSALDIPAALQMGEHSPKLGAMDAEHREAISRAKATHPMMKAARKRGYRTQVEVATAIGIKPNFLSAILQTKKRMPPETAKLLYEKTGYRWDS